MSVYWLQPSLMWTAEIFVLQKYINTYIWENKNTNLICINKKI